MRKLMDNKNKQIIRRLAGDKNKILGVNVRSYCEEVERGQAGGE